MHTELQTEIPAPTENQPLEANDALQKAPKNKNALSFVIFGVLILALLISVGLFATRLNKTSEMQPVLSTNTASPISILEPTKQISSTYTNNLAGYSFDYPSTLAIQSTGMSENPADSDAIHIVPAEEIATAKGISISIYPPSGQSYASERQLVEEGLVNYYASSTSQFLAPENNSISQVETVDGSYTYEIAWKNDPLYGAAGEGIEVWTFYPLAQYTYPLTVSESEMPKTLWVRYDKGDLDLYAPVLNSLKLKPFPQSKK